MDTLFGWIYMLVHLFHVLNISRFVNLVIILKMKLICIWYMVIITVQEFIWVFINNASRYTQGHGFRTELISMLLDLKPRFLRFPGRLHLLWMKIKFLIFDIYDFDICSSMLGWLTRFHTTIAGGCFVEGDWLRNAFRWRESIGPWEERPGHFGDVWHYWTDDGLGYYEFLQVQDYTASIHLSFPIIVPLAINFEMYIKACGGPGCCPNLGIQQW